jgi:hypothetical protein
MRAAKVGVPEPGGTARPYPDNHLRPVREPREKGPIQLLQVAFHQLRWGKKARRHERSARAACQACLPVARDALWLRIGGRVPAQDEPLHRMGGPAARAPRQNPTALPLCYTFIAIQHNKCYNNHKKPTWPCATRPAPRACRPMRIRVVTTVLRSRLVSPYTCRTHKVRFVRTGGSYGTRPTTSTRATGTLPGHGKAPAAI